MKIARRWQNLACQGWARKGWWKMDFNDGTGDRIVFVATISQVNTSKDELH